MLVPRKVGEAVVDVVDVGLASVEHLVFVGMAVGVKLARCRLHFVESLSCVSRHEALDRG